ATTGTRSSPARIRRMGRIMQWPTPARRTCSRISRVSRVRAISAPERFHLCSQLLGFEPLLARGGARLRLLAPTRLPGRLLDQRDETLTRRLPVPRLRTVLAAVDHQHAISGDAVGRQCEQ